MKTATKEQQRQFILNTLIGYKEDITTCGYDLENENCLYLTKEGNKCAVGKHLKDGEWQKSSVDAGGLFSKYYKEDILTEEAFNIGLSNSTWEKIQNYHDAIATTSSKESINLNLGYLEKQTDLLFPELRFKVD